MGKYTISMAILNSYVKLPEGNLPQLYFGAFTQGVIHFIFFSKITIVINEGKTMS